MIYRQLKTHLIDRYHFHVDFSFDQQNVILRHPSLELALKIFALISIHLFHCPQHRTKNVETVKIIHFDMIYKVGDNSVIIG